MKWAISMLERLGLAALLSLALGIFPLNAWGQTDKLTLGQVSGDDISVLGLSSVAPGTSSHAIVFGDGSTVVIHSGKAHVKFEGGGELEICGPAKFTVLASGEALTIALSFGRVHARFDSSRPITIYTPLIVATPMAIGNQPRDTTFGLTNNGAMCLLATRGAVQVQQQLSGETLVVPQPSELLLQGTSLTATPALAESCRCDFDEAITQQAPSPAIASVEPEANTPGQPAVERKSAKTLEPQERQLQS